jgi:hypothetical protein
MMEVAMRRCLALLLFALAACSDGSTDVLVVVQETNVPGTLPDPCDGRVRQDVEVTRTCDGMPVRVVVCSDQPLCQAAVDAIVEPIESCDETRTDFQTDPAPCQ